MPNLSGFIQFIRDILEVSAADLPDDSSYITDNYALSLDWVNPQLVFISPVFYSQAVYNLAASFLLNYGPASVFGDIRKTLGLNDFTAGVISSSFDNSTGQTREVSDALKNLSIADLQQLKDPYGRRYLAIAQQYGDLWGLS